ncbi:MAG: peptide MFS transporter [Prevotella sp.]|uniref:peptide MFS transporter n=1 Tax=Xylanibacter ruminicola TaxID=839 RepID=UPI0008E6E41E|nr:peptide MFS transporter [Xylanibacter ruminicola]MBR0389096.1 peptide MFS transporter [Prevotella sp.]SFC11425.1 proton-dependent oligopeptide transporter, POT family [Xylanibacter ruminicola]
MFENQPKGLFALALANTGERFGYYTMLAVFALFLRANYGLSPAMAGTIYSSFLMLVYFLPLIGGILADKFGFGKMVTTGIIIMFAGYLLLSVPLGGDTVALVVMLAALLLIGFGTGLFKGNLQVMVGDLYNDPQYKDKRDAGFSIFYMAINIGALFAPTAAIRIKEYAETALGYSSNDAYHFSFAVACASLVLSIAIYYMFRSTFRHTEGGTKKAAKSDAASTEPELTKEETKQRIVALCLVFAVVIFFWMAFHQNGLSLTYFADEFTAQSAQGLQAMCFDVWNLVAIVFIVYASFSLFQSKTPKAKGISLGVIVLALAFLFIQYDAEGTVTVSAPIFQQFNPFYVVALTPVSMAIFGSLAAKGKEPSAPRKIAYGMIVAAIAYALMAFSSFGLPMPQTEVGADGNPVAVHVADVTPNLLIMVYLVLTFGELLLSPMGISFVSKVAPPKYKGMMMGGWFVATAIGNQLVVVGGLLWGAVPLWICWSVFLGVCLVAAVFMFAMMKRLEKVC